MNIHFAPTTVIVPQLDSWSHGDMINAAIAAVAMAAFVGTVTASRKQYNFAIRQMNREERKKLYVPVLAMMAAEWTKFDKKMLLMMSAARPTVVETDENLEMLKAKIQSYEFEVEEDLLGSKKVSKAIDIWFEKLRAIMKLFDEFQSENLRTNLLPLNAGPEWKSQRDTLLADLLRQSGNLQKDLTLIVDLVRDEIDMSQKNFMSRSWGRGKRARKPIKNGGK